MSTRLNKSADRIRGGMIETYKIITGKYQGCVAPSLIKEKIYVTRGNDLRVRVSIRLIR